ncbi:glycosyltransferase family 2 protein [Marinicella sediminis]|uniref:Glycosyltransferase family 2 protein n=1 Tax=Marinicella sediminis TaxID=1792834 RepID=A0ABV7J7L2_9GAMM|nr:glycosyltransferase family 2 protein [Marinicella sediminis]
MSQQPVTDVVIVNHNSGQALQQCLQGLLNAGSPDVQLILVDNASSDDSLDRLPSSANIRLIRNSQNVGFAKACNQGLNSGQADCVVFLNPDCFTSVAQLEQLRQQLWKHPEAVLIGCRVLNEDGSMQAASRRRLPTFWRIVWQLTGCSRFRLFKGINIRDDGRFKQTIEVEAINGALMMGRREKLEQLGGFDEQYPLHFEDLDLFARVAKASKTILYDPSVEVIHLKGHSRQDSGLIKRWKRQGLKRFMQLHRPAWEARLVNWLTGSK